MFDFLIVIGSIIDVILSEIDVSVRRAEPSLGWAGPSVGWVEPSLGRWKQVSGPKMFVGDPVHAQPGTPGMTKAEMTGVTVLQSRQTT